MLTDDEALEACELIRELRAADTDADLIRFGQLLRNPRLFQLLRAFPDEHALVLKIKQMWDGYLDTPV